VGAFQPVSNPWEAFVLLSSEEIADIVTLVQDEWVPEQRTGSVQPCQGIVHPDFILELGGIRFDIRQNFGTSHIKSTNRSPREIVLWQDNWKPHILHKYKPIIYYCAFGEHSYETLLVALDSLVTIGNYTGDILLITDKSQDDVRNMMSELFPNTFHVLTFKHLQNIDFYSARYRLDEWDSINDYSPILYMDTDIVVEKQIAPFLLRVFSQAKLAVQPEAFTRLTGSTSVGSELFSSDARLSDLPSDQTGFNSGFLAMPNSQRSLLAMRTIYHAVHRYSDSRQGRHVLSHLDQAFANYVSVLIDHVDLELCRDVVCFYADAAVRINDHWMSERVPGQLSGFVHFWGTANKQSAMQSYIEQLRTLPPDLANATP